MDQDQNLFDLCSSVNEQKLFQHEMSDQKPPEQTLKSFKILKTG